MLKLARARHISEGINRYSEVLYLAYKAVYCYFELVYVSFKPSFVKVSAICE